MADWRQVKQHDLSNDAGDSDRPLRSSTNLPRSGNRTYTSTTACDNSRVHQGDIVHVNSIHNHFHVSTDEYPPVEIKSSNIGSEPHIATQADQHTRSEEPTREWLEQQALKEREKEDAKKRAQKYETLAESLRFLRMSARLLNVEQAAPETCQWIFRHGSYCRWVDDSQLADHHGFMWIKGKPGSGKSTIMKLLHDSTTSNSQDHVTISYFFNGRASGNLEKSSLGLFRYLVFQILNSLPSTRGQFLSKFESKVFNGIVDEWTTIELKGFLSDVLCTTQLPPVNIFIDALDEGHIDDVRQLVAYLEQLTVRAIANNTCLRICLASRHYPHITIRKGLPLMLDEEGEHNQDIRTFVYTTLELEAETLLNEVCKRAAGVFLWVVLVVPLLNAKIDEGADLDAAKALLHKLPTDLDALFTDILDRDAKDVDKCVELLQWVSFARKAMSPESLYEALRIASGDTLLTITALPAKEQLRRFFLHRSRGLLEITRDPLPVVQFIHETVRTFLLTPHGLPRIRPVLAGNVEGTSHEMLKQFCLTFVIQHQSSYELLTTRLYARLRHADDSTTKRWWLPRRTLSGSCCSNPSRSIWLHEYAVRYIFRHSNIAESHGVSQKDSFKVLEEKKLLTILCHCFLLFRFVKKCSSELFAIRAREKGTSFVVSTTNESDLVRLAKCIVGVEHNFALLSSALTAACNLQNVEIARLIMGSGLKNNRRVVAEMKKYSDLSPASLTPLMQETLNRGDIDEVKLLLELGVEINAIDPDIDGLRTALQAAVYWNRKDIFDLLIEFGADVNQRAGLYGTALHVAAHQGRTDMMVALLNLDASIDIQAGLYGTALQAAAHRGHQSLISLLLGAGADVNIHAATYGTALQAAAWSPDATVQVVQLLLTNGASIEAPAGMCGNALYAASVRASLEMMLNEVAGQDHDESSCHAAGRGACRIAIVKALLYHGARITAKDWIEPGLIQAYLELFSFATENDRSDLIDKLLNATINADITDGKATGALRGAALFGGSRQISMLLKHGAKPPSVGVHLRSQDCDRWIWDRFKEARSQLTSHFNWLAIHDDGYYRGEGDSTSRFIDERVLNP